MSRPTRTSSYGPHAEQLVDEWESGSALDGSVVFIHGGFWDDGYDRTHCYPLASALAAQGIQVLLPEYRRVRGAGGWPTTFDDVRSGVQAALRRAESERLVLAGHSAGGQLALWLAATQPHLDFSEVVALAPVADLGLAHELGLDEGAVARLLGGGPAEVPERYALVDPVRLARPRAPVSILHGTFDVRVPLRLSERYVSAHPEADLEELACGHFELINPGAPAFQDVIRHLVGH